MESIPNPKIIEKRAYNVYHSDGIFDMVIGLTLLAYGILNFFDSLHPWMSFVIAFLPAVSVRWLKKKITYPRVGFVKFVEWKSTRWTTALIIAGILMVMVLGFVLLPKIIGEPSQVKFRLVESIAIYSVGIMLLGLLLAVAYLQHLTRLYGYALLIAVCATAGHLMHIGLEYYIAFIGAVAAVVGIVLFIRFLKRYPRLEGDESYAG